MSSLHMSSLKGMAVALSLAGASLGFAGSSHAAALTGAVIDPAVATSADHPLVDKVWCNGWGCGPGWRGPGWRRPGWGYRPLGWGGPYYAPVPRGYWPALPDTISALTAGPAGRIDEGRPSPAQGEKGPYAVSADEGRRSSLQDLALQTAPLIGRSPTRRVFLFKNLHLLPQGETFAECESRYSLGSTAPGESLILIVQRSRKARRTHAPPRLQARARSSTIGQRKLSRQPFRGELCVAPGGQS